MRLPDSGTVQLETTRAFSNGASWLCLLVVSLTAAVYSPVRHFPFISLDDPQYVTENPTVAAGLTWNGVKWALQGSNGFYWHPLTWLSHMLDAQLFGLNAGLHHVTSVGLHILNVILLFGILSRATAAPGKSVFVTALFALHPLRVESVVWVAERKDVLSTLFWMLALWTYLGYAQRPTRRRLAIVAVMFAGGLMAKPMVITLPLVLLLLDYWPLRRVDEASGFSAWKPLVIEKGALFALAAVSAILTVVGQRGAGAVVSFEQLPLHYRLANAIVSYVAYVRDMLWPTRLAIFYPFVAPGTTTVVLSAAGLLIVALLCWRLASRCPYLAVGFLWYLITLLPVIGIVQAGGQARADRFTYVPLIGLFVAITWAAEDIARSIRLPTIALRAAGVTAVAFLIAVTARQTQYWRDNVSLWSHTVGVTSRNYRAENHLGAALADLGRAEEATGHYTAALAIWPEYAEAHNNLGTAFAEQARIPDAIKEFAEAARLKPNDPTFHYNLGAVLDAGGRRSDAIREMQIALRLKPRDPTIVQALGAMSR